MSWFWDTLSTSQSALGWITHTQLYLDFQLATGHPGPVQIDKWLDGAKVPNLSLSNIPCRKRTRWFAKLLKECLRHAGQSVECQYGLPASDVLGLHAATIALPWPSDRLQIVDAWVLRRIPLGVRRTGDALDTLPLAHRDAVFPEVLVSTFQV